jgi:hypothetical protein
MREEIAKLRERVAVLEAAKPSISLNQLKQQWAPVPFSDQYSPVFAHANHPPAICPPGSPFSIAG